MMELPAGWTWAQLGEIAISVKNGIFVSRPGTEPDGVPIFRISAVRQLELRLDDLRYSGISSAELDRGDALVSEGDLLFTRYSGSKDYVGVCARVPSLRGPFTYPDKLIRARLAPSANSKYVAYMFASSIVRSAVETSLRTTAGQVGISGRDLQAVNIPIAPYAEQERIVSILDDYLSRLDAAQRIVERSLGGTFSRSTHLRRSLLKSAAAGELVDQDASDEPADALLARIRAEREAAAPSKKPRKPRSRKATTA